MKEITTLIFAIIIGAQAIYSQESRSDNFIGVGASYGIDVPFGDMADRFGQNFHASLSVDLFKNKWNGLLSVEGAILFGDNVKEDVIQNLRQTNGSILGTQGSYVDVFLRERGTYLGVFVNKIVLSGKKNIHSGLSLGIGAGVLQHNVRLQIDSNNAPQFEGNYKKGYDRNSIGPALKQKLSYLHIGKNKSLNYEISINLSEGFTKNTRGVNFDTGLPDKKSRLDILLGLDFKWMIPFSGHSGLSAEEIFY